MKEKVLFICTHNAARSQMAEGYMRARYGERYEVYSAGTAPAVEIDPRAVAVMAEIGVDLAGQETKALSVYFQQEMDTVVTVCEGGICPMFPWAKTVIHEEFPDPRAISGSEGEVLQGFRRVRDDIIKWIDGRFG
ncbi:arsenate reductase ArsC [Methanofollis formosanus]|uniref:Arsenate reductase ArsC n=1 Tax=Methanofollis formosanus TaxID=299308 RepID=A0A8G1A1A5_9EURY|nr:arsenate reductase ArsC [Methanofollis formosanus]QYZ79176.1 arsenate reductase ArsC [Methanofollis formosanus]